MKLMYHKDNRPTTVRSAGPETVVLEERRGGYQCWNNADIEPHNAEVGDGGPLTHESKQARNRRSLHRLVMPHTSKIQMLGGPLDGIEVPNDGCFKEGEGKFVEATK